MTFKSSTPPLCRWCGRPISKETEPVFFARNFSSTIRNIDAKPKSVAEAQQLVNQKIVSVRWTYVWDEAAYPRVKLGRDYIDMVTVWDGESYRDPFFCNGDHAQRFGYAAARTGLAMPAYNAAIKARNGED